MLFEHLLILLTAIWIFRKIFQWLRFPTLFGEVFAGFIVGPMMLGWVTETEAIKVLAELGVFFLMFHAGLEFSPDSLFKSVRGAVWIAFGGILTSFLGAYFVSVWFGFDAFVAVFIALVLTVSGVEITARMLKDSNLSRLKLSQLSMTAAIVTEVVMLIVFSLFLDIHLTRSFDLAHLAVLFLKVFGYFALVFWFGQKCSSFLHRFLYRGNKGFTLSLIVALVFSVFAEFIGLHFIIGAFLAGLFLQKDLIDIEMYDKLEDRVFGLSYSFLGPIFFASLAFHLDFLPLLTMPWFIGALLIVVVAGKIFGSGIVARFRMKTIDSFTIGLALNTRGAMALILAAVGYEEGIISGEIFSVLVMVSLAGTFLSLFAMKPVAKVLNHQPIL